MKRSVLYNGGTLRYKHEICYVVIVCAEGHFTEAEDDCPHFSALNIDNGRIRTVGEWRVPITNGITWARSKLYSWDHFVFAFHYPTSKGRMRLLSGLVQVHEDIDHESCFKKVGTGYKWVCPDKLDQRVRKRNRQVSF